MPPRPKQTDILSAPDVLAMRQAPDLTRAFLASMPLPVTPKNPTARLRQALGSLRVAVIAATLLGVAIPSALLSLNELKTLREDSLIALNRDLARTAELLAMAMREPIWQFAPDQAESIIEASFLDGRIAGVSVFDASGRTFASKQRGTTTNQNSLSYTAKVSRQDQPIGHVDVTISTADYHQAIAENANAALIRTLVSIAASVALIAWLLHLRLVVPVGRLMRASETVAGGNLNVPIPSGRGDELGRLGESLESMRQKLSDLVAELERSNEELRQTNESLEIRVLERTGELESALDKLVRAQQDMVESEKLASLGRVVAGIAHELNTPIGNALTVASTISDGLRPLIAEFRTGGVRRSTLAAVAESDTGVQILMRNLEKAAEMIANFKQVAVDQTSEQRREFDLAKVTDEVLSTLRPAIRKSGHTLVTDLSPNLLCDSFPGPYGQVLTNLVVNALTHAYADGQLGHVTVRTRAVNDSMCCMIVEDDGAGMSADIKRRIFDPFFTTRMGRGGSGLGMNIVQGFVTRVLGGNIRVDTQPGQGTRFTVEFPRRAPRG
jgi:signal transduction histidine kinase